LLKACEKRPVPMGKLAEIVDAVESKVVESADRELSTTEIGELLIERLQALDKIAYVRFASVYRDFQDVEAFLNELKHLVLQKRS
jgi:transcriptional repressor NrdR